MFVRLIFPFAKYYRKIALPAKWWHRLALVMLLGSIIVTFWLSLAFMLSVHLDALKQSPPIISASPPKTEHGPWEKYAIIANLPSLPNGYTAEVLLSGNGERLSFPPNTTREQMMRALCDHLKQGDEACWQVVDEYQIGSAPQIDQSAFSRAKWKIIARGIGIAFLAALVIGYLLQFLYRTVIFIVYGSGDLAGNAP